MRTIITILDGITETSMPFNEFVLYRANHFSNEKQIVIVCGLEKQLPVVDIPDSLSIIYAGKNLLSIRKKLSATISDCKKNSSPYVVHIHQVKSGILSHLAMLGTNFHKKTIFTVHNTFTGYALHNKIQSFINGLLSRYVVCVSNAAYDGYPKILKRIKGNRLVALQNGVDVERIDSILDEKKVNDSKKVVFIYVARIVPVKNHDFLLDVIKQTNTSAQFVLIGAEDSTGRIKNRIINEGLEHRVILKGLIPRNQVFKELKNADVYVSTSTLEGLPVSVLEAMYSHLPVILSDIPQHREVIGDNDFASIIPFEKDKWVKEIDRYTNMIPMQRQELGNSARDYVLNNFSLKRMHESYNEIYSYLE